MTESIMISAEMESIKDVECLIKRAGEYISQGFVLESLTKTEENKLEIKIGKSKPNPVGFFGG